MDLPLLQERHFPGGGGGVIPETLDGCVRPTSHDQNPYSIYDENMYFLVPFLCPDHQFDSLFMTAAAHAVARYPIYDQNGCKTLPFGPVHIYQAQIREYSPRGHFTILLKLLRKFSNRQGYTNGFTAEVAITRSH